MNGLNKHLGADGIRLHVQCWLTHANIQHFINKAIKFAVTFYILHFTIILSKISIPHTIFSLCARVGW